MSEYNPNMYTNHYLEKMSNHLFVQATVGMDEIQIYIFVAVAGRLHGIINLELIKFVLFAMQNILIAQLSKYGVEKPILQNGELSDNYRAWFAAWTNHFKEMPEELQNTFINDFLFKRDLTKYKYTGNWENYPREKWMSIEFPEVLIPLLAKA